MQITARSIRSWRCSTRTSRKKPQIVALNKIDQPDVQAKLGAQGIEVSGSTPEALQKELLDELAKWTKVIKTAKIKPE